jgi:hypothetical protein
MSKTDDDFQESLKKHFDDLVAEMNKPGAKEAYESLLSADVAELNENFAPGLTEFLSKDAQERVISKALVTAGNALGMTIQQIEQVKRKGQAIDLINCYRALFVLTGGKAEDLKHWMTTENHHTGGIPINQIQEEGGLKIVLRYLEAIKNREPLEILKGSVKKYIDPTKPVCDE